MVTKEKSIVMDHEKLDVYHIAIEFVILADTIIDIYLEEEHIY